MFECDREGSVCHSGRWMKRQIHSLSQIRALNYPTLNCSKHQQDVPPKRHADFPSSVDHPWTLSLRLRLKGTGSMRADGQGWGHKINDDSVGLPVTFAGLKACRKWFCRHRQTPPHTFLRWAGSCPLSRGWIHKEFCFMDLWSSFMEDWQVATNATCPGPCNVPFEVPLVRGEDVL